MEEKKKKEERQKLLQKTRQKKVKTTDDQQFDTNSLSGIWRMLDAASMNDFPITQHGYNFYEDNKTWVNPAEKSWEQKEEIRKKCEEWLKNIKQ